MKDGKHEKRGQETVWTPEQIKLIFQHSFGLSRGDQGFQDAFFQFLAARFPLKIFPGLQTAPDLESMTASHVFSVMQAMAKKRRHVNKKWDEVRLEVKDVFQLAKEAGLYEVRQLNPSQKIAGQWVAGKYGFEEMGLKDSSFIKERKHPLLPLLYSKDGVLLRRSPTGVLEIDSFLAEIGKHVPRCLAYGEEEYKTRVVNVVKAVFLKN